MVMGPVRPRTKNDCAGEGQMQITRSDLARQEHYIPTNVAPTQKNKTLLLSKEEIPFPNKRSWNKQKYGPGP
jgi:hypothetical protein